MKRKESVSAKPICFEIRWKQMLSAETHSISHSFLAHTLHMNAPDFFPKEIHWRRFKEGLKEIAQEHKPGIILIEQSWCSSCKTVGARFCEDKELIELSNQFVMIACCNEEEPNFDEFRPGGVLAMRLIA